MCNARFLNLLKGADFREKIIPQISMNNLQSKT